MADVKTNQIIKVEIPGVKTRKELESLVRGEQENVDSITVIETPEQREFAYDSITNAKKVIKLVGAERLKVTRLLDAKKKIYTDAEKEIISGINESLTRATEMINQYDITVLKEAEAEAKRIEEHNRKVAEQLASQSEVVEVRELNPWESEPEQVATVEPIATEFMKAETLAVKGSKLVKTWELIDIDKVPDIYTLRIVDPEKIEEAMANGVEVPGIKYSEKLQTRFA